jgi:hypothetical protein
MGRRFAGRRIGHDDGNHALSFDVRDYVLEDEFLLLHILRSPGEPPSAIAANTSPKEPVRITLLMVLPSRWKCLLPTQGAPSQAGGNIAGLNRHSPDDSRTGINSSDFLASLKARRELRAATRTTGGPNGGRGVDLAIFPGIWDALLLSVALECITIEPLTLARWWLRPQFRDELQNLLTQKIGLGSCIVSQHLGLLITWLFCRFGGVDFVAFWRERSRQFNLRQRQSARDISARTTTKSLRRHFVVYFC